MAGKAEPKDVSALTVIATGLAVILAIGAVIWFAIPGPDARHRFVSPSGRMALELGEQCRDAACLRVAISETIAADGSSTRRGCDLSLSETRPVLLNAYPLWAADEQSVVVAYADGDGVGGKFALNFAKDCARAE